VPELLSKVITVRAATSVEHDDSPGSRQRKRVCTSTHHTTCACTTMSEVTLVAMRVASTLRLATLKERRRLLYLQYRVSSLAIYPHEQNGWNDVNLCGVPLYCTLCTPDSPNTVPRNMPKNEKPPTRPVPPRNRNPKPHHQALFTTRRSQN
jgi:hypothetical protein